MTAAVQAPVELECVLAPYVEENFPEAFMVDVYLKAKADGTLATVFSSQSGSWTLNQFIYQLHGRPIVVGFVKPTYNVAGVGWLYEVEGQEGARKANAGFVFFREFWGTPVVRTLARQALRWWFVTLKVDVLYGTVLQSNRIAQNFVGKLGFRRVGDLPGFVPSGNELHDAVLYSMRKEIFLAREVADGRS